MLVYDARDIHLALFVEPVIADWYVSGLHASGSAFLDERDGGHVVLVQYRGPLFIPLRDEEAPEMDGLV